MREAHAGVQRELPVDLPVVLNIEILVVIDVMPLEHGVLLPEGGKDANRGIRKTESGIERVVAVVREIHLAFNRKPPGGDRAQILQLQAVLRLETGVERVLPPQLVDA